MWSAKVQGMRFAGVAVAVEVLRSIDRAGGEPVILFPGSGETAAEQLVRVDAVVLPGGADLDPTMYGAAADEHYWPADYVGQDDYEASILRAALAAGVPTLAICRGLQLLNVVRGGALVGHLEPGDVVHRGEQHRVQIEPGSLLATALKTTEAVVSSYHHQAVGQLGEGLRVSAYAPDGIVEGLELPGLPLLAVQWHPEDLAASSATDHAIFQWVVDAGSQQAVARASGHSVLTQGVSAR